MSENMRDKYNRHKLMQCRKHGYAPWGVVCVHILTRTAEEAICYQADDGSRLVDYWFCPECFERYVGKGANPKVSDADRDLVAACVHCLPEVLSPYGDDDEDFLTAE